MSAAATKNYMAGNPLVDLFSPYGKEGWLPIKMMSCLVTTLGSISSL